MIFGGLNKLIKFINKKIICFGDLKKFKILKYKFYLKEIFVLSLGF